MKPLVPASYAQFGVGAERETRNPAFAAAGRSPMAWGSRPYRRGDLDLCEGELPWWYPDLRTTQAGTCIAVGPGLCAGAVCRVAFLAWTRADQRAETLPRPGQGRRVERFETGPAKEDRRR